RQRGGGDIDHRRPRTKLRRRRGCRSRHRTTTDNEPCGKQKPSKCHYSLRCDKRRLLSIPFRRGSVYTFCRGRFTTEDTESTEGRRRILPTNWHEGPRMKRRS